MFGSTIALGGHGQDGDSLVLARIRRQLRAAYLGTPRKPFSIISGRSESFHQM
ncbi:MAG: hypothetical protein NT062_25975 [Proteobacteria bacterium]|nr:hypothetical protein [Pseudomonadota bacterium]